MQPIRSTDFLVLATRMLSGEASGAERRRLTRLLRDPGNKEWFAILQENWNAAGVRPKVRLNLKAAGKRLRARLATEEPAQVKTKSRQSSPGQTGRPKQRKNRRTRRVGAG